MAPSFCINLSDTEQGQLLQIARNSIRGRLHGGNAPELVLHELPDALAVSLAVFVTLSQGDALRGCIGSMESDEPLARSVADAAYGAAFRDRRFPPLAVDELDATRIEISVLSPMEQITVESRRALLATLRPGVDGLLLQDRSHHSTFLPKVWEQLSEPEVFLDHLLLKAGLPIDHWSATLQLYRYYTISFSETNPPVSVPP